MQDDLIERLRVMQQTCLEDVLENAEMAHRQDQREASGRGDRFWHYKCANEAATLATRVQRFLDLRDGKDYAQSDEAAAQALIKRAEDQAAKYAARKQKEGKGD